MTSLTANTIIILALLASLTHARDDNSIKRAVSDILSNEETLPDDAPDNVQGSITLRASDSFAIEWDSSDDDESDSIDATLIVGDITGLEPGEIYDFHIHTSGVISNNNGVIDCNLTGNHPSYHFNPPSPLDKHTFGPHMGDLPRIIADEDGNCKFQIMARIYKPSYIAFVYILRNGANSVIGRSFVIDLVDPKLQVACGVIVATTSESSDSSDSSSGSQSSSDSSSSGDDFEIMNEKAHDKTYETDSFSQKDNHLLIVYCIVGVCLWLKCMRSVVRNKTYFITSKN